MLDFSQLKTPAEHGDVLVLPGPRRMAHAIHDNHRALSTSSVKILGESLASCRTRTREALVGSDDKVVVVTGHQPGLIHPGVWAKHVVAQRLANALSGRAVNLVVDCDAPRSMLLSIPVVRDRSLTRSSIPLAPPHRPGMPYENLPPLSKREVARLERDVRNAMGDRFQASQMGVFLKGFGETPNPRDWVDQMVAGRRAVETGYGVMLEDRRISENWCSPLLMDLLIHARRFAHMYNHALARYRRENHVRGANRPIPDLQVEADRCEVPLWAYREDGPRRRLFVKPLSDRIVLCSDDAVIGEIPKLSPGDGEAPAIATALVDGWRIRPRALTLTLWARLLLADLFIHGIGGAKYDRITDEIIRDYFGLAPPAMACVSATLHLDLPVPNIGAGTLRRLTHAARDLLYNPQRCLPPDLGILELSRKRHDLVEEGRALRLHAPRDRSARRRVFLRIREINRELLCSHPSSMREAQQAVEQARRDLRQQALARQRDYFFALYDQSRLRFLMDALPDERSFRV